ncbi:MAG: AarF/ABC1/UbiB kinase family protein [Bdellovibrionales bacterium]|nr:AarF/ABC1/UbiB kinase family protein [Bdellovibrionales bacterium]
MKKSTGSRSLNLLALASKIGRSEVAQSLKSRFSSEPVDSIGARIEQAQWIADHLSELKGAAMKAGQLLSIDAGDYFPPEAMAILSKLQASAEPVDFSVVQQVLIEEIGVEKLSQFEDLDSEAAAAASIGQVHRASLNGREVAIKVQYPGIAESIESDLKILKTLAGSFASMTGRAMDLSPLFSELKRVLEQEADYRIEKQLMQEYRAALRDQPRFRVPEAVESHSSRRVLTMTWERGVTIDSWLRSRPSLERRERIARAMLDLFCLEFYSWGLVQTDPNFANFLIGTDEKNNDLLVLLDFGSTLRYDDEFRRRYKQVLRSVEAAVSTGNRDLIVQEGVAFGLLDPRESQEAKDGFADLLLVSAEPFHPDRQPFRFEDDDYAKRTRDTGARFARQLKYSPPPHSLLFLHRKLGGIFNFVKKLDVTIDLRPYWEPMLRVGN